MTAEPAAPTTTDAPVTPKGVTAEGARAPFEIRIASGLVIGFGGLVFLAVASVLTLGLWSAYTNTHELLNDKSQSVMGHVVSQIESYLRPAENQLIHIARQIELGRIDAESAELGQHLAGALAPTPEVRSLAFIHADGRMARALRTADGVDLATIDVRAMPVIWTALEAGRERTGLYWGEIVRPETANQALVNSRYPIWRSGRYVGLLAATVQVSQLSRILDDAARGQGGTGFIVYDGRYVLAHPFMSADRSIRVRTSLPTIEELGDPVLSAFVGQGAPGVMAHNLAHLTGIRLLDVDGAPYAVLSRTIDRYSDKPWTVGVYFAAASFTDELRRVHWATAAGGAVLLLSLLVAYGGARYLTAPIDRLAVAARHASELAFARVERLPLGLFAELNAAARAFNSMVAGLRWFESYVPKTLVQRLISHAGEDGPFASKERVLTVMFTDIAGFTTHSERLSAPEVAAMLNRHFALVTGCIEAEGGTVDKFIGDGVMAFWGAPEKQKDHAARACRAALAIAAEMRHENAAERAAGGPGLKIRIGMHSGPVVVGNIGAPGRINYTIVGDTVNIANRLEQHGKTLDPHDSDVVVMLSGATLRAASPSFALAPMGPISVRGREDQVDVFCYRA